MVSFSIDKEIYTSLSTAQQKAIVDKVFELNEFLRQQVYPKIPAQIQKSLEDFSVVVSLSAQAGRDGFFIPEDKHNHKIVLSLIHLNSNGLKSLLAHEFFHAVHYELNPDEEPWIREGMAQLFEYITTHELSGANLQAAIANPFTPLIGRYEISEPNPAQYGHNFLYFYYLYNHCGKDELFWKITSGVDGKNGAALIDSTLKDSRISAIECRDFYSSALSFEAAKVHNQIQFTNESEKERFFLAPTNLPVTPMLFETKQKLIEAVKKMPAWSSMRLRLEDWQSLSIKVPGVKVLYARKSFPYEVSEDLSSMLIKNTDVIIVKTGSAD
jgi:hypothetical protein